MRLTAARLDQGGNPVRQRLRQRRGLDEGWSRRCLVSIDRTRWRDTEHPRETTPSSHWPGCKERATIASAGAVASIRPALIFRLAANLREPAFLSSSIVLSSVEELRARPRLASIQLAAAFTAIAISMRVSLSAAMPFQISCEENRYSYPVVFAEIMRRADVISPN